MHLVKFHFEISGIVLNDLQLANNKFKLYPYLR